VVRIVTGHYGTPRDTGYHGHDSSPRTACLTHTIIAWLLSAATNNQDGRV
jgi:hypothetical protein